MFKSSLQILASDHILGNQVRENILTCQTYNNIFFTSNKFKCIPFSTLKAKILNNESDELQSVKPLFVFKSPIFVTFSKMRNACCWQIQYMMPLGIN